MGAIWDRFERYEQKIDSLESQVDAYDIGKKSLNDEFAELESENEIDDQLAALKAKMSEKKSAE